MLTCVPELTLPESLGLRARSVRRGQFLIRAGEPSDFVFRVRCGGVVLLSKRPGGLAPVDWTGPNGVCGLEDVVCSLPYSCSYRATSATVVDCIPAAAFRNMLRVHPDVATAVVAYLTDRLRGRRAGVLEYHAVTERVRGAALPLSFSFLARGRRRTEAFAAAR